MFASRHFRIREHHMQYTRKAMTETHSDRNETQIETARARKREKEREGEKKGAHGWKSSRGDEQTVSKIGRQQKKKEKKNRKN